MQAVGLGSACSGTSGQGRLDGALAEVGAREAAWPHAKGSRSALRGTRWCRPSAWIVPPRVRRAW